MTRLVVRIHPVPCAPWCVLLHSRTCYVKHTASHFRERSPRKRNMRKHTFKERVAVVPPPTKWKRTSVTLPQAQWVRPWG